jgi:hypothetical protein
MKTEPTPSVAFEGLINKFKNLETTKPGMFSVIK